MQRKFFDLLKQGLEDVIAYKKGKLTLRSETLKTTKPPAKKTKRVAKKPNKKRDH